MHKLVFITFVDAALFIGIVQNQVFQNTSQLLLAKLLFQLEHVVVQEDGFLLDVTEVVP